MTIVSYAFKMASGFKKTGIEYQKLHFTTGRLYAEIICPDDGLIYEMTIKPTYRKPARPTIEDAFKEIRHGYEDQCDSCSYCETVSDIYGTGDSPSANECNCFVAGQCPAAEEQLEIMTDTWEDTYSE